MLVLKMSACLYTEHRKIISLIRVGALKKVFLWRGKRDIHLNIFGGPKKNSV